MKGQAECIALWDATHHICFGHPADLCIQKFKYGAQNKYQNTVYNKIYLKNPQKLHGHGNSGKIAINCIISYYACK